jgi:glucuronate isomerase
MTKTAGDISSVFPSLRPDYKPEPLPPRFKELKQRLFEKNEKALVQSWKRLLESLEKEVHEIKSKGCDVCHSATHCHYFHYV